MSKVKPDSDDLCGVRQPNLGGFTVGTLMPRSAWSEISESEHFVQFYETDNFLLDSLSGFIGVGLNVGDSCIVIATESHRQELEARLQSYGMDLAAARASGQYLSLDAKEMLSKLMSNGSLESERFIEVMGGMIAQAAEGRRSVRAFGEMVALLWAEGNHEAAIQLEEFWNRLRQSHTFSLFCAYPLNNFVGAGLAHHLDQVCGEHTSVIPAEGYTTLASPDDHLRAITLLQQKAKSLQAKITESKEVQERLKASEIRYRRLFETSTDGILMVDPNTYKITDANPSLIALMGTRKEDLLGKELWEIGLLENQEANLNLWEVLHREHLVRYEHLALLTTDHQYRDVEFICNIYQTDTQQIIQCNIRDITERKGIEEVRLHLAAIVETSDDAIISKSLEGIILSWNIGAQRLFGYRAEEVIGKPIVILIPPDRIGEEPVILEKLKRGERIDHYETVRVTKDRRLVNVSLTVSPIKDQSGKVIAVSKIARDITERKQAEARLQEQAEIIETINRTGHILSAELNLQRAAQVVADASTELSGAQFGAFIYKVIDENGKAALLYQLSGLPHDAFAHFLLPQDKESSCLSLQSVDTIRIADVTKDKDYGRNSPFYGLPVPLPVTSYLAVPVISRSGEVLGGLFFGHPTEGVFQERHERLVEGLAAQAAIAMDNAQLYELSQQERAKAEEANRMKDEFLATVSHELRTPLNAIIGWSDLLRKGRLDEAGMVRAIEAIDRNARSQAQLIEDILDVSRVITGKLRLNIEPVDVAATIHAAIDSVQLAADSKSIHLEVMLDPDVRFILGDANRLQQIVWNLLSNAIKFTPSGGRVEIQLNQTGANAQLVFSDTGQGISKDFLPFIFDRFRQADGTTTRKHNGLGLGLAIVRHLVELHGGTIQAHSEGEGKGTSFLINFPLTVANRLATPQKRVTRRSAQYELLDANPKHLPLLTGVQVLLVDDDQDNLHILALLLTNYGALVQAASSAAEALKVLQENKIDVLISDLAMPEEDGYSLIAKIRAFEAHSDIQIPAVALTANARLEDRARALSAGFNLFMSKPVEPSEMITAIASLTESRRR